jgi:5-formyltetrahydrofolate cyclo-ligase
MNAAKREERWAQKARLRQVALRRRDAQPDKPERSERICATLERLPEYRQAKTICSYVGVGSEVLTWGLLGAAMTADKRVIVPYANDNRLTLFCVRDLAELAPAPFGLLEPRQELRDQPDRQTRAADVELFVVPGLAFDATGARLGYGKGYYDHLLDSAPAGILRVGLAFACQIERRVPVLGYDVSMHVVVTEDSVYRPHRSRWCGMRRRRHWSGSKIGRPL